jgi:PmbA protein
MELVDKILQKCADAGADMADVFSISSKTLSVSVRDGRIEALKKAAPGGLAIRFYKAGKMSFAHTTDLSDQAIGSIIPRLALLSRSTEADPLADLPGSQKYVDNLDIYDQSQADKPIEAKIQYLKELEALALKYDPLISKSNSVGYDEWVTTRALGNSKGAKVSYKSTFYRVAISMVAGKNGEMFPGEGGMNATHFADLPSKDKIVEQFASRAVRLIGGTPVDGGDYEIIFTPHAANSILWGLLWALSGDNAFKGASFLADKLGQKVAVENLAIYDDALKPRGVASRPADDEGSASMRNTLIEGGMVKGFLYDMKTAAKAKAKSTGSSMREDYTTFPEIRASNFYLAPGKDKAEDVIASCKKGIIVEQTEGWGLHNVTGQYSAGINGILVENGKRIRPVAGVTIAAGADDILNGIGAICDDITFYDDINSPTIMVKRMTVGS